MPPFQQRDLLFQTHASIPPADFHIFSDGLFQGGIDYGSAGLVVLGQDDLIHE